MNEMQYWEAEEMMKMYDYYNRPSWEQTRTQTYIIAQVNSTKEMKPSDIMHFKWDAPEEVIDPIEEQKKIEQINIIEKKLQAKFAQNKM